MDCGCKTDEKWPPDSQVSGGLKGFRLCPLELEVEPETELDLTVSPKTDGAIDC